ncbi:MAG: sigma-70 family RNA polymerase sigma factor [Deinococcus sp.]|nr:sigma-70 family RNA polymerase sigma factor [Deinococcus sp.]
MIHLAREMLLSNEAAWDAVQDALLDAQRALPRFRGEASFHTWLRRLVTTRCLKVLRRQRTLPIESLDEPLAGSQGLTLADCVADWRHDPVAALEQGYLQQALAQAVCELPPALRAVLVLREVENLSYEEIADVLRIPVGTMRSRLARARDFLRTRLEHWR